MWCLHTAEQALELHVLPELSIAYASITLAEMRTSSVEREGDRHRSLATEIWYANESETCVQALGVVLVVAAQTPARPECALILVGAVQTPDGSTRRARCVRRRFLQVLYAIFPVCTTASGHIQRYVHSTVVDWEGVPQKRPGMQTLGSISEPLGPANEEGD